MSTINVNNVAPQSGTEINFSDNILKTLKIKDYADVIYSGGDSGTAITLAETNGNVQTFAMTGNCTFTMPSGDGLMPGNSITLVLTQDVTGSRTGTFTSVKWDNATAPVLSTAANAVDIITFYTFNGGTTPVWYGFTAGQAMG
jgi:hypothetical protein